MPLAADLGLQDIPGEQGRNFNRVSRPPYLTRAVVVAAGAEYYEWTSVQVRLTMDEQPLNTFRFTASEQEALGDIEGWSALRLRPPDPVAIFLDGYLAITGRITTRQVYYDATQHQVELQGEGATGALSYAPAASKTGEFKQIDIVGLAKALAGAAGVQVGDDGAPKQKFDYRAAPTETAWEGIEKNARAVGAPLTENQTGRLMIGKATYGSAELIEGYNILTGRERIFSPQQTGVQQAIAQGPGSDDASGAEVAQRMAKQNQTDAAGLTPSGSMGRSMMEIPAFAQELLKMRASREGEISDQNQINVTCTVVGWQKEGGGLWLPKDIVRVDSPMLIMRRTLKVKAVTFTQDDKGGTQTSIEMVNKEPGGKEQAQ